MPGNLMARKRNHRGFTLVELPVVRKGETKGFTLVELLVVIAIIALLIALFVPNMTGMLRHARTFQCQNNLHHIGKALTMLRNDCREQRMTVAASTWPGALMRFVDNEGDVRICPEDEFPTVGGDVGGSAGAQIAVSKTRDWNNMNHYIDLDDGILSKKLSQTQRASINSGTSANYFANIYPGYVEDGDPNTFIYTFEDIEASGDINNDWDFLDVDVKVVVSEGRMTLYPIKISSGRGHWLVWADTHEDMLDPPGVITTSDTRTVEIYGGDTSYGLNVDFLGLTAATQKILAVDYEQVVADSNQDDWSEWHDGNGVPTFARHGGKMNVLHMNGSVKLRSPGQIDPVEASVAQKCWQP